MVAWQDNLDKSSQYEIAEMAERQGHLCRLPLILASVDRCAIDERFSV